jgi:hypothetical protein
MYQNLQYNGRPAPKIDTLLSSITQDVGILFPVVVVYKQIGFLIRSDNSVQFHVIKLLCLSTLLPLLAKANPNLQNI